MAIVRIGESSAKKEDAKKLQAILGRPRNYENFIDAYLHYTENQESTRKIHKWVAISIIAAALERKVFLSAGHFKVFPNLYICIVGDSGVVRKSTSTGIGVDLFRAMEDVSIMSERVTSSSLIHQMERSKREYTSGDSLEVQSSVYAYASELIVFLREVFGSISELLTTFYDCIPQDSTKPWIYETKGEGQVKIYGPCLNLLGATTSAWLTRAIPAEEMEGGFSSRVIFVVEKENPDKFIAWPELAPGVEAMKPKLIEDLKQIHALRGTFKKTPEAHAYYEEWYVDFKKNALKQTDARFRGYYGRKPTTVIKIAMALSVAESNDLVFDRRHLEQAIGLLEELEVNMIEAFGATGKNVLAEGLHQISDMIRKRGTLTHRSILKTFYRDLNGMEITQITTDLVKMGRIQIAQIGGGNIEYKWLGERA